jgi:hypothetical protein
MASRRSHTRRHDHSTQLDNHCVRGARFSLSPAEAADREKPTPPRHRFLEPIHNVKEGLSPLSAAAVAAAKFWSSYLENVRSDPRAVSRSKAAPCGALCSAGRPRRRCGLAALIRLRGCGLVERIGIEPMTSSLQS